MVYDFFASINLIWNDKKVVLLWSYMLRMAISDFTKRTSVFIIGKSYDVTLVIK